MPPMISPLSLSRSLQRKTMRPTGKNGRPFSVVSPELAHTFRLLYCDGKGMPIAQIARRHNVTPALVHYHVHRGKDHPVPAWLAHVEAAVSRFCDGNVQAASECLSAAATAVLHPQVPTAPGQLSMI